MRHDLVLYARAPRSDASEDETTEPHPSASAPLWSVWELSRRRSGGEAG
eukprot:CAMPEP_0170315512 /NCGR_PEP_ID=MMETSP0116_2-20130129/58357_1 /TAXON_ID=400756 /ORGANISM="Durinskia baltica, Strain CSIRO CS-38" /LENGTH=48 /DNA_ID= /DNA_START= /DNA_END= /DNA_ORIENTATION=